MRFKSDSGFASYNLRGQAVSLCHIAFTAAAKADDFFAAKAPAIP